MAEETPKKKKGSTHVTHESTSQRDELVESIADALNKANKDAGKCAFFLDQKEDPSTITDWVSTGCDILDLAISNRPHAGIPVGRITEVIMISSVQLELMFLKCCMLLHIPSKTFLKRSNC